MSARKHRVLLTAGLAALAGVAHAADYRTVADPVAILYDAPSAKAKPLFLISRDTPLEVIVALEGWTKVRDVSGDLSWVEAKTLDARRHVVVNVASAKVRSAPDEGSAVVFSADKGVLLELAEPISSGWIKVRHHDGQGGYIRAADVWGD